jgi:hypothetical protein
MRRSSIEVLLLLFIGGVLAASESSSERRLTVKGGRSLRLNTVSRGEFGEAWRREHPDNKGLDYRFAQRGKGGNS